jgi:glycine cleavage system H lipoate-binding protein
MPPGLERCPGLQTAVVRYCAATPGARPVPDVAAEQSLCERDTHLRCPAFPRAARAPGPAGRAAFPAGLRLSPRCHLWLDLRPDGSCSLGVDAFVAAALGHVECVWFVTRGGLQRPMVILSLGPVGLPLTFPHPLRIVRTNAQLRRSPRLVVDDPYGDGWIFEGSCPEGTRAGLSCGLLSGRAAEDWQAAESARLDRFVAERFPHASPSDGLARTLGAEQLVDVFGAFFLGDGPGEAAGYTARPEWNW